MSAILDEIYGVIEDRKKNPKEKSYVCSLLKAGQGKILKKVTEEATEVVMASQSKKREDIIYEVGDLFFHVLVLLGYHDISLAEVYEELKNRRK